MPDDNAEITQLLSAARDGDEAAIARLAPLLYDELRRLAGAQMKGERANHTLQPTALVHDAYLRMIGLEMPYVDRHHFFAMAAKTMRRILVEHARAKGREKRGGGRIQVPLSHVEGAANGASPAEVSTDLLALDEAMNRLAEQDPRRAEVVELFYFAGLTSGEIAQGLDISETTIKRDLRFARAWLLEFLQQ